VVSANSYEFSYNHGLYENSLHQVEIPPGLLLDRPSSGAARFPRRSRGASAEDENRKGGRARPAFPGLVSREDFGGVGAIELVSTSLRCGMLQYALQAVTQK
jgi:hypothetical protein